MVTCFGPRDGEYRNKSNGGSWNYSFSTFKREMHKKCQTPIINTQDFTQNVQFC